MPSGMAFQASTSRPHIPKISGIAPLSVQQAPGAAETAKKLEEDARREKAEREAREAEYALASPRAGGGAAAGKQFCMHCGYLVWAGAGSCPNCGKVPLPVAPLAEGGADAAAAPMTPRQQAAARLEEERVRLNDPQGGRPRTQTQASRNSEAEADSCAFCGLAIPFDDEYCPLDDDRLEDGPKLRASHAAD